MGTTRGIRRERRLRLFLAACTILIAACSAEADLDDGAQTAETPTGQADIGTPGAADGTADGDTSNGTASAEERPILDAEAPLLGSGQVVAPDLDGPAAELITLQEEPYIAAAIYPRPDYEGNPWSQWGQGIALADGQVISAIGDHLGADGNSYLFVYDPETATITRFADVLSALDHQEGSWGYGKVHSQMVDGGDGGIYFTTYWGSRRGLSFDGSYEGDVLFRLDGQTLDLQPLVVPVPGFGVPSLAGDGLGRIYGEAVDPALDDESGGGFFVYDVAGGEVTTLEQNPDHRGFRNVLVGPDGAAFYAGADGSLFTYDPEQGATSLSGIELAAELRASTTATSDGTVFGVTDRPESELFALGPDGSLEPLGTTELYTTSLALLPDESGFLYVPGAHGSSSELGAPLISVDASTQTQTTLVELADLIDDEFGLELGGTYNITIDAERGHAHIGFNAGPDGEPWGEVVFVVIELP